MTFSLFSEKEQPEQAVAVEKHDDLPIMPGESSAKKLKEVERRDLAYGSDQCENL